MEEVIIKILPEKGKIYKVILTFESVSCTEEHIDEWVTENLQHVVDWEYA